jgi:tRNA-specific 2-thiouridylase
VPVDAFTGAAGGAACGDLVRLSIAVDPDDPDGRIVDAGFDASGCGAAVAAASATVALVRGSGLLAAARLGSEGIAAALGGLSAAKHHAAELAAGALHRALGAAASERAALAVAPARTVVAMSGGVDSAVAALLAQRAGQEVVAVTVELWADPENDGERSCCSAQAVSLARDVAHGLGLAHLSVDLREQFAAGVVAPWLAGHADGMTPYPCIRCNGSVRLDAMLAVARRLGADTLVTGHYARIRDGGAAGGPLLAAAADASKDQSYALAAVSPQTLAQLRFPLGEMTKAQVRALATDAGLPVAGRRDSQDLCFLAGTGQRRFLERHGGVPAGPGPIVDGEGVLLGMHPGHQSLTVGQRHGLGLGGGPPLFVLATDAGTNTVTAGPREALLTLAVPIEDVMLRRDAPAVDAVKLRSRGARVPARLPADLAAGRHPAAVVEFDDAVERTAPGQVVCLYAGDLVVGHGTVARAQVRATAA